VKKIDKRTDINVNAADNPTERECVIIATLKRDGRFRRPPSLWYLSYVTMGTSLHICE